MTAEVRRVRILVEITRRAQDDEGAVTERIRFMLLSAGYDVTGVKWWRARERRDPRRDEREPKSARTFHVLVELKVHGQDPEVRDVADPEYMAEVVGVMVVDDGYDVTGVKGGRVRERRAGATGVELEEAKGETLDVTNDPNVIELTAEARERWKARLKARGRERDV